MMVPALVATVAALLPASAEAQDYTSGAVGITVTGPNGAPVSGATITLTSQSQGIVKTLTTSSTGSASAIGLTPGEYDITVTANGFDTYVGTATVVVSQQVTYTYALNTTGATTEVTVKGHRVRQDFNKTTSGLTVDLTTLTSQQAIGRNIQAVTLLAPTAVSSTAFGQPSIGGGSAAENAFYINGLNITNPDTFIGGAEVPFDFYQTVDVQTSGYPAEFGRATGGVVNATTKHGTNDFMFAAHGNFAPDKLRSNPFVNAKTTTSPASLQTNDVNALTLEAGGALIKDKLFLYGLVQATDSEQSFVSTSGHYAEKDKSNDPFYGIKADWYVTPGQHLELTYFDTTTTQHQTRRAFNGNCFDGLYHAGGGSYAKCTTGAVATNGVAPTYGTEGFGAVKKTGGPSWVAKYTGNITDWLTVSAAYGDAKYANDFSSANPELNYAIKYNTGTGVFDRVSKQYYSAASTTDDWERKFYRADADVRFEKLGKHHVRFGIDHEDVSMDKITQLPGAQPIRYYLLPDYSYGYIIYEHLGGHVSGEASSYYIQDAWDVTSTLNLQVGLRNDDFKENNLSGEQFLSLKGNLAPRLGISWRPSEDSKFRFTGFYGQTYIPPAMNLGFRGKDLYFIEGFDMPAGGYTLDANGIPTNMGTPNGIYEGSNICPASDASSAPGNITGAGGPYCAVFGSNVQEPAAKKAAVGLKATRESEYTLGATYRANDLWTLGLTYVNRNLDRVSEDTDFAPEINDYCLAHAHAAGDCQYQNEYHVWNVGNTVTLNTFTTLPDGSKTITLTGLDFPKPKRKYEALTFDFKRMFDGKWGIQGSYTYSRSTGNYEGTVLSTGSGTGQTDAGSTLLYDYPGLAENGDGVLINDRDHTFKVWGTYAITSNFLVSANVQVISPGYLSCYGRYPHRDTFNGEAAYEYGANSHFCLDTSAGGISHKGATYYPYVASGQGKGARTDWTKNVDLALRYTMPETMSMGGKLVLRADIFNLFNNREITARNMAADGGASCGPTPTDPTAPGTLAQCVGRPNANYKAPTFYNNARNMRIGFDLSF